MIYHSGATEGISSIFKGMALRAFKEKRKIAFFFSSVDHACLASLQVDLETFGHEVHFFGVSNLGEFNLEELTAQMLEKKAEGLSLAMNFTYINNETGIVWELSLAAQIKQMTGAFVHVDAVQLVGKIKNWMNLDNTLDAYTFSGHKFGALKGVGFSFLRINLPIDPWITGGTQQLGFRAGTENAIGAYSLKLALEDFLKIFNADELSQAKLFLEESLSELVGDKGEIIAHKNTHRNLNTIFLLLYEQKAELISAKFDLFGIDLSTGSACSSGVVKENKILLSMGYSKDDSRSAIRFSFSPFMTREEASTYYLKIRSVLDNILKH